MAKNTNTVTLSDLLPGEGKRGSKTGLPRQAGTKLSGKAIVERVLKARSGRVVISHDDIVTAGREAVAAYAEANGVKVQASDDELRELLTRNFTTAARQYARSQGARLTIQTNAQTKGGKGQVVVAVAE